MQDCDHHKDQLLALMFVISLFTNLTLEKLRSRQIVIYERRFIRDDPQIWDAEILPGIKARADSCEAKLKNLSKYSIQKTQVKLSKYSSPLKEKLSQLLI